MCFVNAEEIALSLADWRELFPNGFPGCYTCIDTPTDIEAWLPNIARAYVKDFTQWAMSRNAEIAAQIGSCQPTGIFPRLNAMLNQDDQNS